MAAPGSTSPSLDASLIALNFQHRGTLPRLKPYRLEVSTPETSPNWTPALRDFREAGFLCLAIDGTRQRGPALTRRERAARARAGLPRHKRHLAGSLRRVTTTGKSRPSLDDNALAAHRRWQSPD